MIACFLLLYFISYWKAKVTDEANEQAEEGKIDDNTLLKINVLSFIVSWTIVLFNKFVIAKVILIYYHRYYITLQIQRKYPIKPNLILVMLKNYHLHYS